MPLSVSYMGTKRQLAGKVADMVARAPSGPMLDLFSGMCAVGCTVAPSRNIWCNDAQTFASLVAQSFFTSRRSLPPIVNCIKLVKSEFERNFDALSQRFKIYYKQERSMIVSSDLNGVRNTEARYPNCAISKYFGSERTRMSRQPTNFPYRLFSITFSGAYFGLKQCMEIDSIRYAIDSCRVSKTITEEQHRWMLVALCQATSKVSTTTGHFAQHLSANSKNLTRYIRQRTRSVLSEWIGALEQMSPLGTQKWREKNIVTRLDALDALRAFCRQGKKPSVIYADPPYTKDQYSRFYHIYETLILYDYPKAVGVGRYRPDRFSSLFSFKSSAQVQMKLLIEGAATLGSQIIISYPQNGLLIDTEATVRKMIKDSYRKCEISEIDHKHSSLGASKGREKSAVTEYIFRGYN